MVPDAQEILQISINNGAYDDACAFINLHSDTPAMKDRLMGQAFAQALSMSSFDFIQKIFDQCGYQMTETGALVAFSAALRSNNVELSAYLFPKVLSAVTNPRQVYFTAFSVLKAENLARRFVNLVMTSPEKPKDDIVTEMLFEAVLARNFEIVPCLLTLKPDVNARGGVLPYLIVSNYPVEIPEEPLVQPKEELAGEEKLIGILRSVRSLGYKGTDYLDSAYARTAERLAERKQYPQTLIWMLDQGADPWLRCDDIAHLLSQTPYAEDCLRRIEEKKKEADTSARVLFEEQFRDGFTIQRLRQWRRENGENGFTLAAKARMWSVVIAQAKKEGTASLKVEDLSLKNGRLETPLSLSKSRGDLFLLLDPACWLSQQNALFSLLKERHISSQEIEDFRVRFQQFALQQAPSKKRITIILKPKT